MENRTKSLHWGKCALPLGFAMFDFTDLEDNTRQLFHMKDDWMYQDEVSPRMTDPSESSTHHKTMIDEWWAGYLPEISEKLSHFAKEMMRSGYSESILLVDLCEQTLQYLVDGASSEQTTLSSIALDKLESRASDRAGNVNVPNITWGQRTKCMEFEAQDVSFGALHFTSIDMGEEIKFNLRTQRVQGSESGMEGNQCVLKHIAMGLEWIANKRHSRIPSRSRVDMMASELRMEEYQKSMTRYDRASKPSSLMEYEMWPNAHDSMSAGHGRNFKKLGWLLKDMCPVEDFCIRIFDIEQDGKTPNGDGVPV